MTELTTKPFAELLESAINIRLEEIAKQEAEAARKLERELGEARQILATELAHLLKESTDWVVECIGDRPSKPCAYIQFSFRNLRTYRMTVQRDELQPLEVNPKADYTVILYEVERIVSDLHGEQERLNQTKKWDWVQAQNLIFQDILDEVADAIVSHEQMTA